MINRRQVRRDSARRLAVGVPLALAVAVAAPWPMWWYHPNLATVNLAVAVSLVATGVLISLEPGQRRVAVAMAGAGLLWPTIWSIYWGTGPVPLLAMLVGPLPGLLAVWGLLHYPSRPHDRRSRILLLAGLAFTQLAAWANVVVGRPEWHGLDPATAWLPGWPNSAAFQAAEAGYALGVFGIGITVAVVYPLRVSRMVGPDRHVMKPVAIAAVFAGAATAAIEPVALLDPAEPTLNALYTVRGCLVVGVPVAALLAVLRRTLTRNAISVLADRLLTNQPDVVLPALREALSEPNLEILYWLPETGGYVDTTGRLAPTPASDDPTVVANVRDDDGKPLALIVGDPALHRHPQLSGPAARAVALSLANARMQTEIRVQIANVRRSQDRLPAVVAAERRRIEDDVDNGARHQLRLLADHLDRFLDTAEPVLGSELSQQAVRTVREQLPVVQHELRELARGFPPSVLDDEGLPAAVAAMAENLPVPLDHDLPTQRFSPDTERAAYFLVSEGLTNAVKHAKASQVRVRAWVVAGRLRVEVVDDGVGDADPAGHGLTGIADRMRGSGGCLEVDSPAGGGTRLIAVLPL